MALVKCPECGKEVSDMANACPNCGYGVKEHFDNLKQKRQTEIKKRQLEIEKQNKQAQLSKEYEDRIRNVPMPSKPKFSRGLIICLIIMTVFISIGSLPNPDSSLPNVEREEFQIVRWFFYMIVFVISPLCIEGYFFYNKVKDYKLAKTNFRKYQEEVIKKQNFQRAKNNAHIAPQKSSNQVRCPKCGSTNIQLVNRKWSLLTGFMTNKVDRVCVNCKNRF